MNFKKIFFSILFAVAFIAPNFAHINPEGNKNPKALDEIKELIMKIDFDQSIMSIKKAKVYFMVNSLNEVIILQTSSSEVDNLIKNKLNYKTLKNRDLLVNNVYTLPLRFEKE